MTERELKQIREQVAVVGARIQPLLLPCEGLSQRNAFAHIWLGMKTCFGENWRECAIPAEVAGFVGWIDSHPNADYSEFAGPVTRITVARETAEPTLFDH